MSEPIGNRRHGTRWGRAMFPVVTGFALLGAMTSFAVNTVLGFEANVSIMNSSPTDALNGFSLSSSQITALNAGFGMAPVKQSNGTYKNVLRAGFADATLKGLCLSKTESLPVIGNYTLKLISPSSAGDIKASNGVFDLTDIASDTTGTGISLKGNTQIGLSTADITTVFANGTTLPFKANPFGANDDSGASSALDVWTAGVYAGTAPGPWVVDGKPHTFGGGWTGIDAGAAQLDRVAGRLWQVQLSGKINLPGLRIMVTPGVSKCADFPTGSPYTNTTRYDGTNLYP